MLLTMVMVVSLEKKERNIKGDRCNSAKDPPTVKSIFSLGHRWKIMNGWNLPWVDGTCPFYKELEVGLLVWIHHHRR